MGISTGNVWLKFSADVSEIFICSIFIGVERISDTQDLSWGVSLLRCTPMKMERIESSETSALKVQTPGDYSKKHNTA